MNLDRTAFGFPTYLAAICVILAMVDDEKKCWYLGHMESLRNANKHQ